MWEQQWMIWIWPAIQIAAIILGGVLLMRMIRFEIRRLVERGARQTIQEAALADWVNETSLGIRPAVIAVGMILGVFFVLRAMGHPVAVGWNPFSIVDWLLERGVRIILILAGAYVILKLTHQLCAKAVLLIRPYDDTPAAGIERQKRAETVSGVLRKLTTVAVVAMTSLTLLGELNISTAPVLTGLGVAGVAIGFGAQQLVGDLIAGFFLIFENQIRIGDVVVINGIGGKVEEIQLRITVLRGLDGSVHTFRNGTIQTLSNMTKDFSYFVLDLGIAYKEDTDRVSQVLRELGAEMQADAEWGPSILEPVEILGVEQFGDSRVTLKLRIKTLPIRQFDVGREFRRRLKYRFDKERIEIPFPQRTISFATPEAPGFRESAAPASRRTDATSRNP